MSRAHPTGLKSLSPDDLIRQVERGLPFKALTSFVDASGIALPAVTAVIGIPNRTLARRKTAGRLAPDESERLVRISLLFEKALELFEGDSSAAAQWLMTPKRALGHKSPLAYSRTELGSRMVEDLIGRLEHGVFS